MADIFLAKLWSPYIAKKVKEMQEEYDFLMKLEKEMPSKSPKQARLMAACAHGAGYKSCPPTNVAKEFNSADEGTGILKRKAKSMKQKKGKK